jgi:hypothetical protein
VAPVEDWLSEQPRRRPAEYAAELARSRVWRSERRFIATVPEVEDASPLLEVEPELAHALVLVLSRLPAAARVPFAERFYERRVPWRGSVDPALGAAAGVALLVAPLSEHPDLTGERVTDLLQGAAQGDDLSRTPEPVLAELRKTVARVRLDLDLEDEEDPRAAAAIAVVEAIDPSSGVVPLQEILVRAAWAAVQIWEPPRVLDFLIEVDAILAA